MLDGSGPLLLEEPELSLHPTSCGIIPQMLTTHAAQERPAGAPFDAFGRSCSATRGSGLTRCCYCCQGRRARSAPGSQFRARLRRLAGWRSEPGGGGHSADPAQERAADGAVWRVKVAEPTLSCSGAVEGPVDEAVLRRTLLTSGSAWTPSISPTARPTSCASCQAITTLLNTPWLVLVDLDHSADCAPPIAWPGCPTSTPDGLSNSGARSRSVAACGSRGDGELRGRAGIASPIEPETVDNPKLMVITWRDALHVAIRAGLIPREGSGRQVGPPYTAQIIAMSILSGVPMWPHGNADSLRRRAHALPVITR